LGLLADSPRDPVKRSSLIDMTSIETWGECYFRKLSPQNIEKILAIVTQNAVLNAQKINIIGFQDIAIFPPQKWSKLSQIFTIVCMYI
jgi:preprotein translocase subunit SecD